MSKREPLNREEKERIYRGKLAGRTLVEMAAELNCSIETARKWWRRGRDQGLAGLRSARRGRGKSGILSQFEACVVVKVERHKREHPGWGADRVLIELRADPELQGLALPKRSRMAAFFKERCPECVAPYKFHPALSPGAKSGAVHEIWQMDCQEGVRLADGEIAIICNIRDPFGAAPIASQAFRGKTEQRWRKLEWTEYRQVLRQGFSEWRTLPDSVWTDNELRLIGNPSSDFPSLLTLYLAGLGIKHRFIRPAIPTDHAQVERGHRTLDGLAFERQSLTNVEQLQHSLDRERQVYLWHFPSHASDCAGRPPLQVHPELLHPRRPYQPESELQLFSMQQVFDFLATFTFERKISHSGCVSLTHQVSIGRNLAREIPNRMAWVRCDPVRREWVFYRKSENDQDELTELVRRPIERLDVKVLTGLDPEMVPPVPQPVQLSLPFLVP